MCTQERHKHDMPRALRTMSRRRTPSTQAIPEVAFLSLTSLCSDTKKIRQTFNRGVTRLRKILSSSCSGLLCFEEITLRQFFLYILALAIKGCVFLFYPCVFRAIICTLKSKLVYIAWLLQWALPRKPFEVRKFQECAKLPNVAKQNTETMRNVKQ